MLDLSLDNHDRLNRDYKHLRSILITGTKGKTSTSLLLNHIFTCQKQDTLYVNTAGVMHGQQQLYTGQSSIDHFGMTPTVMPGRYIYGLLKRGVRVKKLTAILESSLGCGVFGTGLHQHKVGALLNIYSDHIGNGLVRSRADLYQMKSFIFNKLQEHGYYVANLDNDLSRASLSEDVLRVKKIHRLAVTARALSPQRARLLQQDFQLHDLFYLHDGWLQSVERGKLMQVHNFAYLQHFPHHQGLRTNLLAAYAIAAIFVTVKRINAAVQSFRFPFAFGRMIVLENQQGQRLIVDYAHEPKSLQMMVNSLSTQYHATPLLVTRAAPHRTQYSIDKLAQAIARLELSGVQIYDLIDEQSVTQEMNFTRFRRGVGDTAALLYAGMQRVKPSFPFAQVNNELLALTQAVHSGARVILHIYGNIKAVEDFTTQNGWRRVI